MSPEPPTLDESDLLRRTAQGDREAFARLYDAMAGNLHGLALQMLGDAHDAQDLLQDVFLQIWKRAGDFNSGDGRAFSWVAKILRNRAIDRLRSTQRRIRVHGAARPAFAIDLAPGANHAAGSRETASLVRKALAELPEEHRQALELAFFGSMTQEEIASAMHQPLGTVKAHIRRGLLKLRDAWRKIL